MPSAKGFVIAKSTVASLAYLSASQSESIRLFASYKISVYHISTYVHYAVQH